MNPHRSYAVFRASLRSMPTLESIEETIDEEDMEPLGEPPDLWETINFEEKDWTQWQEAREEWGQWTEIDDVR